MLTGNTHDILVAEHTEDRARLCRRLENQCNWGNEKKASNEYVPRKQPNSRGQSSVELHTDYSTKSGRCQMIVFVHLKYHQRGRVHSNNVTEGTQRAEERMTIDERFRYLRLVRQRYVKAHRKEPGVLLTEMERATGIHRKTLIGLMYVLPRSW